MAEVLPNMITVGLKNTLILAMASTLLGTVIGIVLADDGDLRQPAIEDSRASLHGYLPRPARHRDDPDHRTGLRTVGRELFGPSPYPLGILALSLIAGAYIGEIFRAGIQSVERGQLDATRTLGMTYGQGMRLVVIPQGIRRVLAGAGQSVHRQRQRFESRLLPWAACFRAGIVSRWTGPGGRHRQSLAAAACRHILSSDHGAADPPRQLHRPAHARRQAANGGTQRPEGSRGTGQGRGARTRLAVSAPSSTRLSRAAASRYARSTWPMAAYRCCTMSV